MDIVNFQNVSYKIGTKYINDNISFSIELGDIASIIGANGSGKSTLLRLLSGELEATMGEVLFKGKNISDWNLQDLACNRSILSQSNSLSFPFKVFDIIHMGRYPYKNLDKKSTKNDSNIVYELLEYFDLLELRNRNYLTLSGGEKQRVQIARVFAQIWSTNNYFGRLLILDEPNSFLDISHQIKMFEIIKEKNNKGLSVVMVLHDINQAIHHSNNVIMLKDSKLECFGMVKDVINKANVGKVFNLEDDSEIYSQSIFIKN